MNASFSRRTIAALAALLLAGTLSAVAGQLVKQDVEGIRSFTRVDATVACAGATDVSAIAELARMEYRSIVNLRLDSEEGAHIAESRAAAEAAGITFIHVPFDSNAPDTAAADAFLAAVTAPEHLPVFIHCGSGNRAAALWMIKRVLKDGWSIDDATKEARAIGLRSDGLRQFALSYVREHQKSEV
jgi:uncharacterized protein (TIGR01244 family)